MGIMDCCRSELQTKGKQIQYTTPTKGSLCMIYATKPGELAEVLEKITFKLVARMEECLKEKGAILFPDDIIYFDHPS